jgi:hypothetical protein
VIQNREDYENKMTALVNGIDYEKLRSDPTKTIENKIASLIKKSTEFDAHKRRLLTPTFSKPPHIYGQIKIHKEIFPIRPIVSGIDSPCNQLAKYLVPILNPLVGNTDSYIKNTSEFVEKVKDRVLPSGSILASLDVVNLFTTTPTDGALSLLRKKLECDDKLKSRTNHTVDTLMELVSVCITNTYFQFGDNYYIQRTGMAMGSPLSPVLCNLYSEDLEPKASGSFVTRPHLFLRYIDDIYVEWPEDICLIEELQNHFNSVTEH